ncbi:MFS transporter [uncultured Thiodictyon sp.]|uniref:MFS transporter n=1 Tax=uncultured Thiodictyon sp. TaxID=1846217 RepID=UPI0025D23553|nr:MFS transporter [uncultured Thiodictyon sp.]
MLLGVNIGNAIEFYDWMAYSLLVPYFGKLFFPHEDPASVLLSSFAVFAVGSLARPVGAIVLGRFIDRHGRRPGLVVSVTLMVAASFGIALLPVYASVGLLAPLLLVVLRLMQGFALGPELGGSATYLAESAPDGRRGLFAATYQSSVALGTLAVAGLISILHVFLDTAQMESFGWRIVFGVGGLVALSGLALRRTLPETDQVPAEERRRRQPFRELWRDHRIAMVRILTIASAGAFVLYGFSSLLPSLGPTFTAITPEQAAHVNTIGSAAMLVASPFLGLLSDRIGRRWTIRLFAIAGLFAIPVMASLDGSVAHQLIAQLFAVALMCIWAAGAFAAFPEMLPQAVRAAGIAVPYGLAAAGVGGFAPMIATTLSTNGGLVALGWAIAAMTLIAGAATIGMKETADSPLRVR